MNFTKSPIWACRRIWNCIADYDEEIVTLMKINLMKQKIYLIIRLLIMAGNFLSLILDFM